MKYDEGTMTIYMKFPDACRVTGISQYELRQGCKAGRYPHIIRGQTYYLNMPLLIKQLEEQSKEAVR